MIASTVVLCIASGLSLMPLNWKSSTWSADASPGPASGTTHAGVIGPCVRFFELAAAHPNHVLRALSTDCSDHCPLLLMANVVPWVKKRFRFEPHWVKFLGFFEVVKLAWSPTLLHTDPFRVLDYKLRNVARALKSWSDKRIDSVLLQLALAREVILHLEVAQESRSLTV